MFQRVCMGMRTHIIALTALLASAGCGRSGAREAEAVVPELKLEGVRFRVYRGQGLRAFGEAETASLRRDSSDVRAQELDATVPGDGEPLHFSAPAGEGSLLSRAFTVSGGVVATRGEDVARTARARYEPGSGSGVVRGDDPVTLAGRGYRLEGAGFTLDPEAGTIVVGGGAKLVAGIPVRREAP
jgi:lipopolysaccharide export system protein LptC